MGVDRTHLRIWVRVRRAQIDVRGGAAEKCVGAQIDLRAGTRTRTAGKNHDLEAVG